MLEDGYPRQPPWDMLGDGNQPCPPPPTQDASQPQGMLGNRNIWVPSILWEGIRAGPRCLGFLHALGDGQSRTWMPKFPLC